MRKRRLALVAGGGFILLLVSTSASWFIINAQATRRYEAARDDYMSNGGDITTKSLRVPESVSESTSRYLQALDLDVRDFESGADSGRFLSGESFEFPPEGKPWELESDEWDSVARVLKDNESRIQLLLKAASFEDCLYPLHYEDGWDMKMPHVGRLLSSAHLLAWDARHGQRNGNVDGCWERVTAILGLADSLKRDCPMVSHLVRFVMFNEALEVLGELLPSALPPGPWKALLERHCDIGSLEAGLKNAFRAETVMWADTAERYFRGERTATELDQVNRIFRLLATPRTRDAAARGFGRMRRVLQASGFPDKERLRELESIVDEFSQDPLAFSFLTAAYPKAWRQWLLLKCRISLAREALRLRHRFPDSDCPPSLEMDGRDPLFSRPWKYSKIANGFRLDISAAPEDLLNDFGIANSIEWVCAGASAGGSARPEK